MRIVPVARCFDRATDGVAKVDIGFELDEALEALMANANDAVAEQAAMSAEPCSG